MTDIKLLPLPLHTEAGEFTFDAHVFEHEDMVSYARDNVEHHTAAQAAEIELLRAEIVALKTDLHEYRDAALRLAEALREAQKLFEWNAIGGPLRRRIDALLRDHDKEGE